MYSDSRRAFFRRPFRDFKPVPRLNEREEVGHEIGHRQIAFGPVESGLPCNLPDGSIVCPTFSPRFRFICCQDLVEIFRRYPVQLRSPVQPPALQGDQLNLS